MVAHPDGGNTGQTASGQHLLSAYHTAQLMMVRVNRKTKDPVERRWQHKSATLAEAEAWLEAGDNLGLQVGPRSRWLGFIDLDDYWARILAPKFLPETLTSGKEGEELPSHYAYIAEGLGFKKFTNVDNTELICIKASNNGKGHQCVVAPSIHPEKGRYYWSGGFDPNKITRVSAEDLERRGGLLAAASLIAKHMPPIGGRHHYSLHLFGFLIRNGMDPDEAADLAIAAWDAHGAIEIDGGGLRKNAHDTATKLKLDERVSGGTYLNRMVPRLAEKIADALGWERRRTNMGEGRKSYYRTDYGNGQRFVDQHGDLVRYVSKWHKWIVWDGQRWKVDDGETVARLAHATARRIFDEAKYAADVTEQRAIVDWAMKSQSRSRIESMLWSAAPYVAIQHTELDKDPWLLNVENGTINLKTGELQDPNPDDLITKLAPVRYDKDATAPTYLASLQKVLPSEALRRFVQRVLGYATTGDTSEHILPFLHGLGANGKTTLVNAIIAVLGDYAQQAAPDLLLAKHSTHPTELADLFGARFVASVEVEDGRRLAESLVKQLTGGDRIKARRMREDFWEFPPTHKIFLAANHKPIIRGTDHGMWRRIKLIPFEVQIPEAEQDKQLPEKLAAEAQGILAWLVRGCLEWQRDGLGEPAEVTKATAGYRSEMDVLGSFIEDECVSNDGAQVSGSKLYTPYRMWCERLGERATSHKAFAASLRERGYEQKRFTSGLEKGRKGWSGIGLRVNPEDDSDPEKRNSAHKDEPKTGDQGSPSEPRGNQGSPGESGVGKPTTEGKHTNGDPSDPKVNINDGDSSREVVIPENGSPGFTRFTKHGMQDSTADGFADENKPDDDDVEVI